ncbi:nucleotide sugar dehydrogenase [Castellaniella sp.]|uniref:nucleotide sugar dehydrogenase n=1 Tax=Castellaniella sp. TaxID=1955812 RepID=UPI00355EEA02
MNITVVGTGYVGLSNGLLLAQHDRVVALDVDAARVAALNQGRIPVDDPDMAALLRSGRVDFQATTDPAVAYAQADYVVIATPTDHDPASGRFDTGSIEAVARDVLRYRPEACIILKSTVPVGYTEGLKAQLGTDALVFSPEFLREGQALHDNLYPTRIVMGEDSARSRRFVARMQAGARRADIPVLYVTNTEAEAIKLFANTYLAMRVAYFNELDTYAATLGLDTRALLAGVGTDPRIGQHYNNPSFGYGGYCLPKDTRQLLAHYRGVPQNLMQAIVQANATRKDFIAADVLRRAPGVVGVYRLVMKQGSDNFRDSSALDVMQRIQAQDVPVIVYEPVLSGASAFRGATVVADLAAFKRQADVILANRWSADLADVAEKVYTRDLFGAH